MTAGVSDRCDEHPLATNEIGHVEWKSGKIDASKTAGTLSPEKRLPDHSRANAHDLHPKARTQTWNLLFVVSGSVLDLSRRFWQELQRYAHFSGAI